MLLENYVGNVPCVDQGLPADVRRVERDTVSCPELNGKWRVKRDALRGCFLTGIHRSDRSVGKRNNMGKAVALLSKQDSFGFCHKCLSFVF